MHRGLRLLSVHTRTLEWLEPIVTSWFGVLDSYCEKVVWKRSRTVRSDKRWNGVDCPWWYTERANIGLLAAGAVKKGKIALEEFNDEKKTRPKRRASYKGRVDLMIWRKPKLKGAAFEAKMAWANLKECSDALSYEIVPGKWNSIRKSWSAAIKSASAVHDDYSRHALLFLPVVVSHGDPSGSRLRAAMETVRRQVRLLDPCPGLTAYYAPRRSRRGKTVHAEWTNRPGGNLNQHIGVVIAVRRLTAADLRA